MLIESEIKKKRNGKGKFVTYFQANTKQSRKVVYAADGTIIVDVFGDEIIETQKSILCGSVTEVGDEVVKLKLKSKEDDKVLWNETKMDRQNHNLVG